MSVWRRAFGHVEPVWGIYSNHSLDDPTVYPDDVLVHSSDQDLNPYYRPFHTLQDTPKMEGNCRERTAALATPAFGSACVLRWPSLLRPALASACPCLSTRAVAPSLPAALDSEPPTLPRLFPLDICAELCAAVGRDRAGGLRSQRDVPVHQRPDRLRPRRRRHHGQRRRPRLPHRRRRAQILCFRTCLFSFFFTLRKLLLGDGELS